MSASLLESLLAWDARPPLDVPQVLTGGPMHILVYRLLGGLCDLATAYSWAYNFTCTMGNLPKASLGGPDNSSFTSPAVSPMKLQQLNYR